jgi:hypothetical protein
MVEMQTAKQGKVYLGREKGSLRGVRVRKDAVDTEKRWASCMHQVHVVRVEVQLTTIDNPGSEEVVGPILVFDGL